MYNPDPTKNPLNVDTGDEAWRRDLSTTYESTGDINQAMRLADFRARTRMKQEAKIAGRTLMFWDPVERTFTAIRDGQEYNMSDARGAALTAYAPSDIGLSGKLAAAKSEIDELRRQVSALQRELGDARNRTRRAREDKKKGK